MDSAFREALTRDGARLRDGSSVPDDFGDGSGELRSTLGSCGLAVRSDLSRIRATGPDILGFLHRLSTADLRSLSARHGRPTVLTTPKGRIVQRLFVHHLGSEGVLMVGGPESAAAVILHLERFVFSEVLGLSDVTEPWVQLALVGPRAREAVARAGLVLPEVYGSAPGEVQGVAVQLLGHDGLSKNGISVVVPETGADVVWRRLRDAAREVDGAPVGGSAIAAWRILLGLPENGAELTEDYNPLEAGLWDAVSFDKGCYVGQEVVARLRTYDKVTRGLRGFSFRPGARPPGPGAVVSAGSRQVGSLTSAFAPPGFDSPIGLGYVKSGTAEPGDEVVIDDLRAEVVDLPFDAARAAPVD